MRTLSVLIVALLLSFTSCSQNNKSEESNYKKYPFKSAIIEYTIFGNTTGSKTTYIDDYGYKQADFSEITTEIMGFKTTEKKNVIIIGSNINTVDHETKSVFKSNNPYAKNYAENVGEDYIKIGEDALLTLGFEKKGTASILGKECTVWEGMNTIWTWKGLVLKSESEIMGIKTTELVTSIKTDIDVPSSKFEVPTDYKVKEMSNIEGLNDVFSDLNYEEDTPTDEEKEMMRKVKNMSFKEFKKLMMKEDPEMSDEEIENVYKIMQKLPKK